MKNINSKSLSVNDKIKANETALNQMSNELLELKKTISGGVISPALKKDLDNLNKIVEEKKQVIAELTKNTRTIEKHLDEKKEFIKELGTDLKDQTKQLEIASKKIFETEGIITTLKNKLNSLNKENHQKEIQIENLKSENHNYEKELMSMKNKIKIFETKLDIISKQKIELLKSQEDSKLALDRLTQERKQKSTNQSLEKEEAEKIIFSLKENNKRKITSLMQEYTRKISLLTSQKNLLKKQIERKDIIIRNKEQKEKLFLEEINAKFNSVLTSSPKTISREEISQDFAEIKQKPAKVFQSNDFENPDEIIIENEEVPVEQFYDYNRGKVEFAEMNPEQNINDITAIIESGLEHSDSKQSIIMSLLNAGYTKENIDSAFSIVNNQNN